MATMSQIPSQAKPSKFRLCSALLYLNLVFFFIGSAEGSLVSELSSAICEVLSRQEKCTWSGCVPVEWTGTSHGCGHGTLLCENPSKCAGGMQYKCCEVPTELSVPISARKRGKSSRIHVPFPGFGGFMPAKGQRSQTPAWWWSTLNANGRATGVRRGAPPAAAASGIAAKRGGGGVQSQPEIPQPAAVDFKNVDFDFDESQGQEHRDYDVSDSNGNGNSGKN